ncbi:MAG: SDR family oxidoreductase [Chloroflexota bacterium]
MKITVFGATGGTGKEVVKEALNNGHEVVAFARTPANVPMNGHDKLTIVQGDALNADDIAQAIAMDTDAVISVLGHRPKSTQDGLLERSIELIMDAMREKEVERLLALSGAGAWISDKDKPGFVEHGIRGLMKLMASKVLSDSEEMAKRVMDSDLQWTVPRGPRITDGERTGEWRVGYVGVNSGMQISYADIAAFLVQEAEKDQHIHDAPVVSY